MLGLGSSHFYINTSQTGRAVNGTQNWTKRMAFTFFAMTEIGLIIIMVPFDLKYLRAAYNWEIIGTGWWKLINFICRGRWWEQRLGNKTMLMCHEAAKSLRVECQSENQQWDWKSLMQLLVSGWLPGCPWSQRRETGWGCKLCLKTAKIDHDWHFSSFTSFHILRTKLNEEDDSNEILKVESEPHSMFLVFY